MTKLSEGALSESSAAELYPESPVDVPGDVTRAAFAYQLRVWVAVSALLLFLTGYLALSAWFVYSAYQNLVVSFGHGAMNTLRGAGFGILALIFAALLLKAFFRRQTVAPTGLFEVDATDEPELFRFLYRLADEAGAPRPHRVYISARVNAAVFFDTSLLNLFVPAKKNLEIGIGLVNVLNLSEFKAAIAHELGHFAQRSMAVGRWVYVAQGIVDQVVRGRDRFDEFILSRERIRIPVLGPVFRLALWALRAVVESAFMVVLLVERSLSREMELQADRVAVAIAGSESLVHTLHRLEQADRALDEAGVIATFEARAHGVQLPDIFEVQRLVLEELEQALDDHGRRVSGAANVAARRVFGSEFEAPERMWASHPATVDREANAKRRFVSSSEDSRSAWLLFNDPAALRSELTDYIYERAPGAGDLVLATARDAARAVRNRFQRRVYEVRYRGAYLGRCPARAADDAQELFGERASALPKRGAVLAALDAIYPEEIAQAGETELASHDLACRRAHLDAARRLGHGWEKYLQRLLRLLHYASHTAADLTDAYLGWRNEMVLALSSGRVTKSARRRIAEAGTELHSVLRRIRVERDGVVLPKVIAERLGVERWEELLRERFDLKPPVESDPFDWVRLGEPWYLECVAVLAALRDEALEALLEAEELVAQHLREETPIAEAPELASVPKRYPSRTPGSERPRRKRLGLWDRFLLGDGVGPGIARFAVASGILGCVVAFCGAGATSEVVVLNGLECPVTVHVAGRRVELDPGATERLRVPALRSLQIETYAHGESIESEAFDVAEAGGVYIYNVAGAAVLDEWSVSYGRKEPNKPSRLLGAPLWYLSKAEYTLETPPETLSVPTGGIEHQVVGVFRSTSARMLVGIVSEPESQRMIEGHAMYDDATAPSFRGWLELASWQPNAEEFLKRRLARDPLEIETLRQQQDIARMRGTLPEVCEGQRRLADLHPDNSGLSYLRARCIDDPGAESAAYEVALQRFPKDPWLRNAVAWGQLDRGDYASARASLEALRKDAPGFRDETVLLLARLRRVTDASLGMAVLREESSSLDQMVAIESGSALNAANRSNYWIHRGEFRKALEEVDLDPAWLPRVLRLVGASQGAPEDLVARAAALKPEEGVDGDTLMPSLALAARFRMDLEPYAQVARLRLGDASALVLGLLDNDAEGLKDTARMEKVLKELPMQARAATYMLACSYLGERAPLAWRQFVMAWFFAPERPYFQVK